LALLGVGNPEFKKHFRVRAFRVVNNGDLVTTVPPTGFLSMSGNSGTLIVKARCVKIAGGVKCGPMAFEVKYKMLWILSNT
jgi:hypothetical protein